MTENAAAALKKLVISVAYAGDTWIRHTDAFEEALSELGWRWNMRECCLFDDKGNRVPEPPSCT